MWNANVEGVVEDIKLNLEIVHAKLHNFTRKETKNHDANQASRMRRSVPFWFTYNKTEQILSWYYFVYAFYIYAPVYVNQS